MRFNTSEGKKFLAALRDGYYAHPGSEEAIELLMAAFDKDPQRKILDMGCGHGGTAYYVQTNGWGKVTAVDLDKDSIDFAKTTFPDVSYFSGSVEDVDNKTLSGPFDLIYLFNSFYNFPNQLNALKNMANLANPKTRLAIFDYAITKTNPTGAAYKSTWMHHKKLFTPLKLNEFEKQLNEANWQLTEIKDITQEYKRWYEDLMQRFTERKESLINEFSLEMYEAAFQTYQNFLDSITDGDLRGAIIYAEKS